MKYMYMYSTIVLKWGCIARVLSTARMLGSYSGEELQSGNFTLLYLHNIAKVLHCKG